MLPFARRDKAHGEDSNQSAYAQTGDQSYPKHMLTSQFRLPPKKYFETGSNMVYNYIMHKIFGLTLRIDKLYLICYYSFEKEMIFMPKNYQKELDNVIHTLVAEHRRPRLLLHSCCGPCSSYVLEYLSKYFDITLFYYNPNIFPREEYDLRLANQQKVLDSTDWAKLLPCEYDHTEFLTAVKGLESLQEGGERCTECFRLRLERTAKAARDGGYDCFTTTLTVSPHKNAELLNRLGEEIGKKYGVSHLPGDFKKREGYKRSIVLSEQLGLYRQNYCGCEFSKRG